MSKATVLGIAICLAVTMATGSARCYPGDTREQAEAQVFTVSQRPVRVADNTSPEMKALEGLVRKHSPIRADAVMVQISGDWAFADVAERDAKTGDWMSSTSALLRRSAKGWKILAWGDYMEWDAYAAKMSPNVRKAFERWKGSHY